MTVYQRKRKLGAFLVLAMLLYGRHAAVVWKGPLSCVITTNLFAKSIGMQSHRLRFYVDWLKRNRYVTALTISHGFIELTLAPPVDREESAA